MNVSIRIGDLLESDAQTLVNTVNCVGVMGRGIALAFKKQFPEMYRDYVDRCEAGELELGRPYLYRSTLPPWVLNFPTKDHWRSLARIDDIVAGLEFLEAHYLTWGITSLAVPPLGCGEGQLEWRVVGPTLYRHLARLEVPVALYAPFGTPPAELEPAFLAGRSAATDASIPEPRRVPVGWFALASIVAHLVDEPGVRGVGRVAFQKLAYLATEAGIPTQLSFERDSYGPYSAALKKVTSKLVNNGVLAESRDGRSIVVMPGRTYEDAERVFRARTVPWSPKVEQVAGLLAGRTTRQAEVLATALFAWRAVAGEAEGAHAEAAVAYVLDWKQRRRPPFAAAEVEWALSELADGDWLRLVPGGGSPGLDEPRDAGSSVGEGGVG